MNRNHVLTFLLAVRVTARFSQHGAVPLPDGWPLHDSDFSVAYGADLDVQPKMVRFHELTFEGKITCLRSALLNGADGS